MHSRPLPQAAPATPYTVIIPARLASTRLPNKPLADIGGLPMVVRVARQAQQSQAQQVVVATDAPQVLSACAQHGVRAVLTRSDHASGSDRLAEAVLLLGLTAQDIVINVQGDEPFIPPQVIDQLAAFAAARAHAPMCTLAQALDAAADFYDPNVVKVVLNTHGDALYFSRAAIPYPRDQALAARATTPNNALILPEPAPLRHIGLYSYRVAFLQTWCRLPVNSLEQVEALEQLRVLAHGYAIAVLQIAHRILPSVDTPADLARARAHCAAPSSA